MEQPKTAIELFELLNGAPPAPVEGSTENSASIMSKLSDLFGNAPLIPIQMEEQVEPEPQIPQPTCKYLAPSQPYQDDKGAETPDEWEYSRLPSYFPCMHPVFNERGKIACDMIQNQTVCMFYEPSVTVTVQRKKLYKVDTDTIYRVSLSKTRFGFGLDKYEVTSSKADENGIFSEEVNIIHVIDAEQHGTETKNIAQALFTEAISSFDNVNVVEDPLPVIAAVIPPSYLKTLIEV